MYFGEPLRDVLAGVVRHTECINAGEQPAKQMFRASL
jgi:hypothetical protein